MIARRHIIPNKSLAHVFFRCHNRQFFLKPSHIKEYLILLLAKYKKKYGIKIYEVIVMDNHCHLLVESPNAEALGNFMRTVNSLLARYINRCLKRDSQAIRERYKSPLITSKKYFKQVMVYIWLNRFKVDKSDPSQDRYCSAAWRCHPQLLLSMAEDAKEKKLLEGLLDELDYVYPSKPKDLKRFVTDLLNAWIGSITALANFVNQSSHTVGDELTIEFRSTLLKSMKKETIPWESSDIAYHSCL